MSENIDLQHKWNSIIEFFKKAFTEGDEINIDGILYMIGVQELGNLGVKFKKDDKINLMHIAICTLLEPYGYYKYSHRDSDGWPHFVMLSELPSLKAGEQSVLMKQSIIKYFEEAEVI